MINTIITIFTAIKKNKVNNILLSAQLKLEEEKLKQLKLNNDILEQKNKIMKYKTYLNNDTFRDVLSIEKEGDNIKIETYFYSSKRDIKENGVNINIFNSYEEAIKFLGKEV